MPQTNSHLRLVRALITGAATTAWYAVPDFVASRPVRVAAKAGLVAVLSVPFLPATDAERAAWDSLKHDLTPANPSRAVLAAGATAVVAATALTVVAEKAIFRRGERRRQSGHRLGHTPLAFLFGVVGAAFAYAVEPFPAAAGAPVA